MTPRDTTTGRVFEHTVVPALRMNGYTVRLQVCVGTSPGGGEHKVDGLVETPESEEVLVSSKWQQSSGTAEQKVPFELIRLLKTMDEERKPDGTPRFSRAYIVLGGDGWTLRDYYTSGEMRKYIEGSDRVRIVTTDQFITLVNKKEL